MPLKFILNLNMYLEGFERHNDQRTSANLPLRKFGTDLSNLKYLPEAHKQNVKKKAFEGISLEIYSEMIRTLYENEEINIPSSDYMLKQSDINSNMRAILIDWLIYIQYKLKYSGETLYLTVNLIDRYLEKVQVLRKDLQLIGICCMLIACKYEEVNVPKISDLVYITDNAYTNDQVVEMESSILSILEYNITFTSPLKFAERLVREMRFNRKQVALNRYLMELSLLDYRFIKVKPSVLAKACCLLVNGENGKENFEGSWWRGQEKDAKECAGELAKAIGVLGNCSLQALKNKYSSLEYCEVALGYRIPVFVEEYFLGHMTN